jgi:hypothetical protein
MISLDGFGRLRHQPERFDFDYHSRGEPQSQFPA